MLIEINTPQMKIVKFDVTSDYKTVIMTIPNVYQQYKNMQGPKD